MTRLAAAAACLSLAASGAALAATAARAATSSTAVSSNWAGYAVHRSGTRFRSVSASWVVPTASCTSGSRSYAAAWVGLGGFSSRSESLEQTGTELDCHPDGGASYSAWYELVPANAVTLHMTIRPGDRISASVQVRGHSVRIHLRNLTTGAHFTRTRRMSSPDVTSAEWIVEAPSECTASSDCRVLPLSDFGSVSFSRALAKTLRGHTGTITDSAWSSTKIELSGDASGADFPGAASDASAVPSRVSSSGSAFSVSYKAGSVSGGGPPTTFPGGGPG